MDYIKFDMPLYKAPTICTFLH